MGLLVRHGTLATLLALVIACGSGDPPRSPTAPSSPSPPSPSAPRPPAGAPVYPPVPAGAQVFVYDGALNFPAAPYTEASRYVLVAQAFELQYGTLGIAYGGSFTEQDGPCVFASPAMGAGKRSARCRATVWRSATTTS